MEKIQFKNGQEPCLNDINLNKMQDNIEEAINEKADITIATQEVNGLMSKEDKEKLDNISNATIDKDGLMSKEDKVKLDNTLEFEEIEEFEFEDE